MFDRIGCEMARSVVEPFVREERGSRGLKERGYLTDAAGRLGTQNVVRVMPRGLWRPSDEKERISL